MRRRGAALRRARWPHHRSRLAADGTATAKVWERLGCGRRRPWRERVRTFLDVTCVRRERAGPRLGYRARGQGDPTRKDGCRGTRSSVSERLRRGRRRTAACSCRPLRPPGSRPDRRQRYSIAGRTAACGPWPTTCTTPTASPFLPTARRSTARRPTATASSPSTSVPTAASPTAACSPGSTTLQGAARRWRRTDSRPTPRAISA